MIEIYKNLRLEDICIEFTNDEIFDATKDHLEEFSMELDSFQAEMLAKDFGERASRVAMNNLSIADAIDELFGSASEEQVLSTVLESLYHSTNLYNEEVQAVFRRFNIGNGNPDPETMTPERRTQFAKDLPVDIVLSALAHKLNQAA